MHDVGLKPRCIVFIRLFLYFCGQNVTIAYAE